MNHSNYSISFAQVKVQSPSNIAFIKYWGKSDGQIPKNPSLSMTLSECRSETSISFSSSKSFDISSFRFEGVENEAFKTKTKDKLLSIKKNIPWINSYSLSIDSQNTFPHSSGIASSASGFSAIVYALLTFEARLFGGKLDLKRASDLARLCSGSASRSLFAGFSHWGQSHLEGSTNRNAVEISYPIKFENAIAIVSKQVKDVSSSVGHKLMDDHPFAQARYEMANSNLKKMDNALKENDLEVFGDILENEALTLHSLMLSSKPSFILLDEASLTIIKRVRKFRESTGYPVYFTIDAGPNIHLIYPEGSEETQKIREFIKSEITPLCDQIIFDRIGVGPLVLEEHYE